VVDLSSIFVRGRRKIRWSFIVPNTCGAGRPSTSMEERVRIASIEASTNASRTSTVSCNSAKLGVAIISGGFALKFIRVVGTSIEPPISPTCPPASTPGSGLMSGDA
jgi:hypothetical protein